MSQVDSEVGSDVDSSEDMDSEETRKMDPSGGIIRRVRVGLKPPRFLFCFPPSLHGTSIKENDSDGEVSEGDRKRAEARNHFTFVFQTR